MYFYEVVAVKQNKKQFVYALFKGKDKILPFAVYGTIFSMQKNKYILHLT